MLVYNMSTDFLINLYDNKQISVSYLPELHTGLLQRLMPFGQTRNCAAHSRAATATVHIPAAPTVVDTAADTLTGKKHSNVAPAKKQKNCFEHFRSIERIDGFCLPLACTSSMTIHDRQRCYMLLDCFRATATGYSTMTVRMIVYMFQMMEPPLHSNCSQRH